MSESRRPVIRKPTPAEELAKLHPIERFLLRAFESMSSVKLAVVLMLWLVVECVIGTIIESRVNAQAARYFVYQTVRFYILLALLGMNILCAALIRFPWRLYQTGFVVTHCGLLILLVGSLITSRFNVDTQLSVRLGSSSDELLNVDAEELKITRHRRDGDIKTFDPVPVNFGPFTWGSKVLFGAYTWRPDYRETYEIGDDLKIHVKQFFANCSAEDFYAPTENGVPVVQYRLYHPERADVTRWLAAERRTMIGEDRGMGMGKVVLWGVSSQAEFDHFLKAVPSGFSGLRGTLGYSHAGKHYTFKVDDLLKEPQTVPDTDITIAIEEYLPNAQLDTKQNKWYSEGDVPENPLLMIQVKQGDKQQQYMAFGAKPEWQGILSQRFGTEHLFTYFPADIPPVVHLAVSPDGEVGYRAFGSQGMISCELVEKGKDYPCWAGLFFSVKEAYASAKLDFRLRPKLPKKGELGDHGIVVELDNGKEKIETALRRGLPVHQRIGDELYTIEYTVQVSKLPFKVQLDNFKEPKNPGTQVAAAYESEVTVIDGDDTEKARIYMNHPYYRTGSDGVHYTLYQSGIDYSTGVAISTLTVASDPGLETKYAGSIVLCTGIFLMFYMGGYFKKTTTRGIASKRTDALAKV